MKQELFDKIIDVIDEQSLWARVLRGAVHSTRMVNVAGTLKPRKCKTLVIFAVRPHSVYPKGHSWSIPEQQLDKALRALKRNGEIGRDGRLTSKNVESLICRATDGFVNLNLI